MMCKAIDAANFFIDLAIRADNEDMTNLRVNKLLYFAQGWHLAKTGKPLFEENIEAWKYGPVVQNVYNTFKVCGNEKISQTSNEAFNDVFNDNEILLLLDVMRYYEQFSTSKLVDITHKNNSPWRNSFKGSMSNNIISQDELKEYFSNIEPLKEFTIDDCDMEFVGYRDNDGFLVLPAEFDDEE